MQINLTPDPSLLVIMAIFIANYLVVRRFFLKPVNEVIVARERESHEAESLYNDALAKFNAATAEIETRVHQARREASAMRDSLRAEATAQRSQMLEGTRKQADGIVSSADAQLTSDVAAARDQIVRDSDSLARLAAERIVGRTM